MAINYDHTGIEMLRAAKRVNESLLIFECSKKDFSILSKRLVYNSNDFEIIKSDKNLNIYKEK
ncbi:MAG TPA: hypothetical protein VNU45_19775 [Rummeliibacillus sp.]|nr:hypothetical protein [Rummeliibacillus sp.]